MMYLGIGVFPGLLPYTVANIDLCDAGEERLSFLLPAGYEQSKQHSLAIDQLANLQQMLGLKLSTYDSIKPAPSGAQKVLILRLTGMRRKFPTQVME